ncbi:MAG: DsbA family oxidoreductase [Nitrosomonadales bacterium]|nr:DsbA family oxidoreductase [Nitrosomonadales bacterium]
MRVEIWSDVICPWCYIGKRNFEKALADFPHREQVQIVWRSFELDPGSPRQLPGTLEEMLAKKYRVSRQEAAAMISRVTEAARGAGLEYRLDQARSGNTFDVHRLLHHAAGQGLGAQATERLMHAYFCESLPVGERTALARLAPEFGIAENEAMKVLESEDHAAAVRADEARAASLGINVVPSFVFGEKHLVTGAKPVEGFAEALQQAMSAKD